MNATPPEANYEYSRGHRAPAGDSPRVTPDRRPRSALATGVLCGGLLGAVLLIVAEFTTLYNERTSTSSTILKSVATGSNNSYAMLPIAIMAAVLAYALWRSVNRLALLALGVLGLLALLISLLNDLPDAHRSGLVGSSATHYVLASTRPSAGFYMETLGAVLLMITSVSGLLMLGSPRAPAAERRRAGSRS